MSGSISKIIHELNNKNFNKALNLCEEYSENNDLHILNNLKGIIFINLKDHQNAIEYFKKSLKRKLYRGIFKEDYTTIGYKSIMSKFFLASISESCKTIYFSIRKHLIFQKRIFLNL